MAVHAQQQVIAPAGNYDANSSGSISWTLGEPVTETFLGSASTLTQGFQQTFKTVSPVNEINSLEFKITALPNPASDRVILTVENPERLQYRLYDLNGRLLRTAQLETTITGIDLTGLSPSVYFLKIIKINTEVKTFKLIKQ
jgi:hypothetical protein